MIDRNGDAAGKGVMDMKYFRDARAFIICYVRIGAGRAGQAQTPWLALARLPRTQKQKVHISACSLGSDIIGDGSLTVSPGLNGTKWFLNVVLGAIHPVLRYYREILSLRIGLPSHGYRILFKMAFKNLVSVVLMAWLVVFPQMASATTVSEIITSIPTCAVSTSTFFSLTRNLMVCASSRVLCLICRRPDAR